MLYRLFLFKPKYRRINNIVYWALYHYTTEEFSKNAAAALEKFAAETVKEELESALPGILKKKDTILVKASHFCGFGTVVKIIKELS